MLCRRRATAGRTLGLAGASPRDCRLGVRDQAELLEDGYSVILAEFLRDQAVLKPKHRGSGAWPPLAGAYRQGAQGQVVESCSCVGATTLPAADDVLALPGTYRRRPGRSEREPANQKSLVGVGPRAPHRRQIERGAARRSC